LDRNVQGGIDLFITDSDHRTVLAISPGDGGGRHAQVANIFVYGSLKSIVAPRIDLHGDLILLGSLKRLRLGDLSAGEHRIDIGGPSAGSDALSVNLGRVSDLSLTSLMPVTSLRAMEWRDTDSLADQVKAPRLGKLTVRGDFEADLILAGDQGLGFRGFRGFLGFLGKAKIGGDVRRARWRVDGGIGRASIVGQIDHWQLDFDGHVKRLALGNVRQAVITGRTELSHIGRLSAQQWSAGRIEVGSIKSIVITGVRNDPTLDGSLGADLILTNPVVPLSLNRLSVAGWLEGATIRSAGPIGRVTLGGVRDSALLAGMSGQVRTLSEAANEAETARDIQRLTIRGFGGPGPSFVNSLLAARSIGRVALKQVHADNGGAAFGVVARDIRSYQRPGKRAAAGPGVRYLDLDDDFEVKIV